MCVYIYIYTHTYTYTYTYTLLRVEETKENTYTRVVRIYVCLRAYIFMVRRIDEISETSCMLYTISFMCAMFQIILKSINALFF